MPSPKQQPTIHELFGLVEGELKRSINKPNILRYGEKKYPEQLRFHQCNKRARYVSGGNRGGKTDAEVVEAIWWATNTHPYLARPLAWGDGPLQLRFVVVDVAKGIEQIMLPKFKRWMTGSMLVDGSWDKSWDSKNSILTFSNGSTIDFLTHGMELDKFGGVPRHIIFFDEEPPQHIFNESLMRLLDYRGWWVIAATPVHGMGWTFDLLWEPALNNPDGEVATFVLSADQNPYIETSNDDMDFYMIGMDKQERDVREHGSFVARSGLVFPNFSKNIEQYVIDPFIPPKKWEWYSSTDFGINNPTAWLWHAVSPEGDIVTFAEHYKSDMNVPQHSAVVRMREAAWGREPDIRVGDPAGNQRSAVTGTSVITEYALRGLYISTEMIPHEVMIGIEKMQQYLGFRSDSRWSKIDPETGEKIPAPRWVITSNCVNLIRELKKLRWATYSSDKMAYEMNKQETVHKKDDHAFDSARYFATLMPELAPDPNELTNIDSIPTTLSYQEMMAKLRDDDSVEFVDDEESEPEDQWHTEMTFGDYFEGAY